MVDDHDQPLLGTVLLDAAVDERVDPGIPRPGADSALRKLTVGLSIAACGMVARVALYRVGPQRRLPCSRHRGRCPN
jgi:hypothetical protein